MWEDVLSIVFAVAFMLLAAMAIGQVIDNHAARSDPASTHYAGSARK